MNKELDNKAGKELLSFMVEHPTVFAVIESYLSLEVVEHIYNLQCKHSKKQAFSFAPPMPARLKEAKQ
ncbi:hypothetical protein [Vibrio europaeus]|uniref:hypothetical protein n=1 Tax=Vibrio europaeus TaxID=300876 RepID=UPI00233F40F4|nr:hypothetical protein [Vibrio europaeus]MDC5853480.1 hypothetical protein [Vibrio europaeus]